MAGIQVACIEEAIGLKDSRIGLLKDAVVMRLGEIVSEWEDGKAAISRVRALLEQWEKDIKTSEKLGISTMWSGPAMAKHLREELEGQEAKR